MIDREFKVLRASVEGSSDVSFVALEPVLELAHEHEHKHGIAHGIGDVIEHEHEHTAFELLFDMQDVVDAGDLQLLEVHLTSPLLTLGENQGLKWVEIVCIERIDSELELELLD